tara:strand:- start:351 stop:875 length:525 start_codon:yes stop_codon:yes gene_type:complete
MSHAFALEKNKKAINAKANREFSKFSKRLRQKVHSITDYNAEFEKIFGDFGEKKLPRDELYFKIKNELEAQEDMKKDVNKKINGREKILPKMHDNKIEEIQANLTKVNMEQELKKMAAKELSGEIPPQEMPDKPLHSAEQILTHRMAFQGEFAKVDDEIKCQLKALVNNDLPTF